MGIRGLGHLAEPQIEALREENVQKPDPVPAGRARAQMREGVGETGGRGHLDEDIGDPHLGQAGIKVEHERVGFGRRIRSQPFKAQGSVFDGAARDRAFPCRGREPVQSLIHAGLAIGNPGFWLEGNRESGRGAGDRDWNESLLQVAVATRMRKPYIARTEGIAHVEQHRHLPEAVIAGGARIQTGSPFRARVQERHRSRRRAGPVADDGKGGDKRLCHRRAGHIQRPKHALRVAPQPAITLHDMGQGIGLDRIGQLHGYGHELFEGTPATGRRNRVFQRRTVLLRLDKRRPETLERTQRGAEVLVRLRSP